MKSATNSTKARIVLTNIINVQKQSHYCNIRMVIPVADDKKNPITEDKWLSPNISSFINVQTHSTLKQKPLATVKEVKKINTDMQRDHKVNVRWKAGCAQIIERSIRHETSLAIYDWASPIIRDTPEANRESSNKSQSRILTVNNDEWITKQMILY